ncbi:hypothetical protein J2755_001170 [Methanohalophilus levihalophilus]|nr:hypothetical protein [Methanohalophilus levihalophilus]
MMMFCHHARHVEIVNTKRNNLLLGRFFLPNSISQGGFDFKYWITGIEDSVFEIPENVMVITFELLSGWLLKDDMFFSHVDFSSYTIILHVFVLES